jgi:hypothetical protein
VNKEMNYKRYISSNILGDTKYDNKLQKSEVDAKVARYTKNKALANSSEYNQSYRIALLSRGQMFGDQDACYGLIVNKGKGHKNDNFDPNFQIGRPYQATVIWRSNDGELYQISRDNFKKLQSHGDCWQKITSKYITQEHLHYRLLKNQQKFNNITENKKKHKRGRSIIPINIAASKSPLLNKNEIEKRHILEEIVNDFPYAEKQMKFVEAMYKDTKVITDEDVKAFQKSQKKYSTQRKTVYEARNLIKEKDNSDFKNDPNSTLGNSKNPKMAKGSLINEKNAFATPDIKKTVYISSRISRCIESMLDNKMNHSKISKLLILWINVTIW